MVTGSLRLVAVPFVAAAPSLDDLRASSVVAVDVNHGHLAAAVIAPDGNVLGAPATIGLDLAGLPSATRDGRLRAAISALIATAKARGARAIVIEDLDFAEARAEGRERAGSRPSRGRRGRDFRRAVCGIPTGKLRDRLVQMAANAGLSVIVIDPAYTSRWGAEHWLRPLREHHPKATGHHAAAVVTGRRGLGHRARRRATGNQTAPAEAARPAQARTRTTPARGTAPRKPAAPRGPRQPPGAKTGRPHRTAAGNRAAQDRSGPPARQDYVLLVQQERSSRVEGVDDVGVLGVHDAALELEGGGEFPGLGGPFHGQQAPPLDLLYPGQLLVGGGYSGGHLGELVFRRGQKESLVQAASVMAIAGLLTVGLAVSAAVLLVASFVTSALPAALVTALVACMFGLLWFAFPLTRR